MKRGAIDKRNTLDLRRNTSYRRLTFAILGLVSTATTADVLPGFSIVPLQDSGFSYSVVKDINQIGQAAGSSVSGVGFDAEPRPVFWDIDGQSTLLENGAYPSTSTQVVRAINDNGEMVGEQDSLGQVVWNNFISTQIPHASLVFDINNSGQIVGSSNRLSNNLRAALWNNLTPSLLGGEPSTFTSEAIAINNLGQVVGNMSEVINSSIAVSWLNNQVTILGTFPGYESSSQAFNINDNGSIVGYSGSRTNSRAVIWENGLVADLGTLGGGTAKAVDINNMRQIIGEAETASGQQHPFLWQDGKMFDLAPALCADLAMCSVSLAAINDGGEIVYTKNISGSNRLAYKLSINAGALETIPSFDASLNFQLPVNATPLTNVPPENNEADVSIRMRSDVASIESGGQLRYQVLISNNGPSLAKNIIVTDKLPKNVDLITEISALDNCKLANSSVTCQYEELGIGNVIVINLTVQHKRGKNISNTVSVDSEMTDTLLNNNSATLKTRVFR